MDLGNINGLDAALTVLILASAIFGMFRGMIRGVFGVIALVLAFLAAKKYGAHPMMVQGMTSVFGESAAVTLAGVALVFTASLLAFSALTFMLHKFADEMDLGFSDKSGGFFFGLVRGIFFAGLAIVALSALPLQNTSFWNRSTLLPMFGNLLQLSLKHVDWLAPYKPHWKFDKQNRPLLVLFPQEKQKRKSRRRKKDAEPECDELSTDELILQALESNPGVQGEIDKLQSGEGVETDKMRKMLESFLPTGGGCPPRR